MGCIDNTTDHNSAVRGEVFSKPEKQESISAIISAAVGQPSKRQGDSTWNARLVEEVVRYQPVAVNDMTVDVLSFWARHSAKFPLLSGIARISLTSPATSTTSERVFSLAGIVRCKRRSRLSPGLTEVCVRVGCYIRRTRDRSNS